ncbi:MAG: thiolase family protein [Deltaproteobacteria bacterium]|nr:thiolase family protein [Deltaproteobacteria bacterium]
MRKTVILNAVRTPVGSFLGLLSGVSAPRLGAVAIRELIQRTGIDASGIDEVIMGNVLTGGEGQAPARQAARYAGIPDHVGALTINKVCGSGLKSVMLADQIIRAGDAGLVIAGGMESMSGAPYFLEKARSGYRMGNGSLMDSMIWDGLWDPYNNFHMGSAAELCAKEYHYTREAQDRFAVESYRRAQRAISEGLFVPEIAKVEVQGKKETVVVGQDEEPSRVDFAKVSSLKPAFAKDGTITAANASTINDGAGAVAVASEDRAKDLGQRPLARIVASAQAAKAPEWFTTAPIEAVRDVLKKAGMTTRDIDLYEINEAFAVVTMVAMDQLGLDHAKVNVRGGAVAIGHPIGASGTRLLVTLLHTMSDMNKSTGLVTLCIGGGEAVAVIVERV